MRLSDAAITHKILGGAIAVHRAFGPGMLESAYESCLAIELARREVPFVRQVSIDLDYEGVRVKDAFRLDLLVADRVVVEVKAVATVLAVHEAQLITYLKVTGKRTGLLLNFNTLRMKDGITRRVL